LAASDSSRQFLEEILPVDRHITERHEFRNAEHIFQLKEKSPLVASKLDDLKK
jgi:hypothetical protein